MNRLFFRKINHAVTRLLKWVCCHSLRPLKKKLVQWTLWGRLEDKVFEPCHLPHANEGETLNSASSASVFLVEAEEQKKIMYMIG